MTCFAVAKINDLSAVRIGRATQIAGVAAERVYPSFLTLRCMKPWLIVVGEQYFPNFSNDLLSYIQAKLAIAEIETKAQNVSERLAFVEEFSKQPHAQARGWHEAMDQNQERAMARPQQDVDSMSQAIDQAHQMGMAQIQQPQEGE
jgi:hypothetical protein